MNIQPSIVGKKVVCKDGGTDSFLTANLTAIDQALTDSTYYPYAYTATVDDTIDSFQFNVTGQTIAAGQRLSCGVFLSADNDKGAFMFNVSGGVIIGSGATETLAYPIFGRTNASTVTSTKAAQANLLDWQTIIDHNYFMTNTYTQMSFNDEVYAEADTADYIYCCAVVLENGSGSGQTIDIKGWINMYKYADTMSVYMPERM